MSYTNLLLINKTLSDIDVFINSCNENTFPLVYSESTTYNELNISNEFQTGMINRIAIVCHNSQLTFVENKEFMSTENTEFIISMIKKFKVKNIDFLACDTLNDTKWTDFYTILFNATGVIIGASNDKTGNIKFGGDWVMESTIENIENVYFSKSIEYYQYLLSVSYNFTQPVDWNSTNTNYSITLNYRVEYINLNELYKSNHIGWVSNFTSSSILKYGNLISNPAYGDNASTNKFIWFNSLFAYSLNTIPFLISPPYTTTTNYITFSFDYLLSNGNSSNRDFIEIGAISKNESEKILTQSLTPQLTRYSVSAVANMTSYYTHFQVSPNIEYYIFIKFTSMNGQNMVIDNLSITDKTTQPTIFSSPFNTILDTRCIYTLVSGKLYKNGSLNTGFIVYMGNLYNNDDIYTDSHLYNNKLYTNGKLNVGYQLHTNGNLYNNENLNIGYYVHNNTLYFNEASVIRDFIFYIFDTSKIDTNVLYINLNTLETSNHTEWVTNNYENAMLIYRRPANLLAYDKSYPYPFINFKGSYYLSDFSYLISPKFNTGANEYITVSFDFLLFHHTRIEDYSDQTYLNNSYLEITAIPKNESFLIESTSFSPKIINYEILANPGYMKNYYINFNVSQQTDYYIIFKFKYIHPYSLYVNKFNIIYQPLQPTLFISPFDSILDTRRIYTVIEGKLYKYGNLDNSGYILYNNILYYKGNINIGYILYTDINNTLILYKDGSVNTEYYVYPETGKLYNGASLCNDQYHVYEPTGKLYFFADFNSTGYVLYPQYTNNKLYYNEDLKQGYYLYPDTDGNLYHDGVLKKGYYVYPENTGKLYYNGYINQGYYIYPENNGRLYYNENLSKGYHVYTNGKLYYNESVNIGYYTDQIITNDMLYNGESIDNSGYVLWPVTNGKLYYNGYLNQGYRVHPENTGKLYYNEYLNQGYYVHPETDGRLYNGSILNTGYYKHNNILYYNEVVNTTGYHVYIDGNIYYDGNVVLSNNYRTWGNLDLYNTLDNKNMNSVDQILYEDDRDYWKTYNNMEPRNYFAIGKSEYTGNKTNSLKVKLQSAFSKGDFAYYISPNFTAPTDMYVSLDFVLKENSRNNNYTDFLQVGIMESSHYNYINSCELINIPIESVKYFCSFKIYKSTKFCAIMKFIAKDQLGDIFLTDISIRFHITEPTPIYSNYAGITITRTFAFPCINMRYKLINQQLFLDGIIASGYVTYNGHYKDGNLLSGLYIYKGKLYNNSDITVGYQSLNDILFYDGNLYNGNFEGKSYKNGYLYSTFNYTSTTNKTLNNLDSNNWNSFENFDNYFSITKTITKPSYTTNTDVIKFSTNSPHQLESYLISPSFNTEDYSNIILNFDYLQFYILGEGGFTNNIDVNIIESLKVTDIKNNDGFIINAYKSGFTPKFNEQNIAFLVKPDTDYRIFIKFKSSPKIIDTAIDVINIIKTNYVITEILTFDTILDRTITGYSMNSGLLYMNNAPDTYITFNGNRVFYKGIYLSDDYNQYNFNTYTTLINVTNINNFASQSNWFSYITETDSGTINITTPTNLGNWNYEKAIRIYNYPITNYTYKNIYLFSPKFNANSNYVTFYFEFIRISDTFKIGIIRSNNLSNISNILVSNDITQDASTTKYQNSITFKVIQNQEYFIFLKCYMPSAYLRNFSIIHSPQSPSPILPVTDVFDVSDRFKFNNILYNLGMPNTGYAIYPINNGDLYLDTTLAQGYNKFPDPSDQKEYLYKDGYKHNGSYETLYYSNGTILTGLLVDTLYINGLIPPNYYKHTDNKLYFNGVIAKGFVLYGNVLSETELFIDGFKPSGNNTVMNSKYTNGNYVSTTTASTSGDPYINTFAGFKYKLPNIIRTYRLLDFHMTDKCINDTLTINASVSPLREEEKNIIMSIDKFKKHNPVINGFFYNEFYISTNNSYILLDRMFNLIKCSNITDFEIILQNTPKLFKCDIQGESLYVAKIIYIFGVRIELRLFDNPQILNGIEISVPDIKNVSGLLSSRINPKNFMIKTITDTKKITIKSDKIYNRVVKENWIKVV